MTYVLCQRCGKSELTWTIQSAEFNVGGLDHWTVQLCRACTNILAQAIVVAFANGLAQLQQPPVTPARPTGLCPTCGQDPSRPASTGCQTGSHYSTWSTHTKAPGHEG